MTPRLRYKPDGRPYVDYVLNGRRCKRSLVPYALRGQPLTPEQCERQFAAWLATTWPALQAAEALKIPENPVAPRHPSS